MFYVIAKQAKIVTMMVQSMSPPPRVGRAVLKVLLVGMATRNVILPARAACDPVGIRIYQGDLTLPLNNANPIITDQTVSEFYDYNPKTRSYMGKDLPVAGDTSLLTIHQDSRSCDLSMVMVHSARGERGLDRFGDGWVRFYVNGDMHQPVVQDDPLFTAYALHYDNYDSFLDRIEGFTSVSWVWDKVSPAWHREVGFVY
jgi:hypothetical protein